jgi:hypothetical protein
MPTNQFVCLDLACALCAANSYFAVWNLVDFFPNIFNPWLIESTDAASASMEG